MLNRATTTPAARITRAAVRRGRRDAPALRRLERGMCARPPGTGRRPVSAAPPPSFDQLAGDLRRLHHCCRPGATFGSERWRAAVVRAYDRRLELACGSLGLTQHLHELDGLDRDLERLRIEGHLEAEGLKLR